MPKDGNSLLCSIISSEWIAQGYYPFQLTNITKPRLKMALYARWGALLDAASAILSNNADAIYGNDETHTGLKYQGYIFDFNTWMLNKSSSSRPMVDFDLLSAIFPNGSPYTEWSNCEGDEITPCQTNISIDPNEVIGKDRKFSLLELYYIMRSSCHTLNDGDDNFSPLIFQFNMAEKLMMAWHIALPLIRSMAYRGTTHTPSNLIFYTKPNDRDLRSQELWRSPANWVNSHKDPTQKYLKTKLDPVYFHQLKRDEQPVDPSSQYQTKKKN
jgi:hypothetical protein